MPLPKVYVIANYKETQLTHVAPGQPVEITVDSFPREKLRGRVERIAPATGAQVALLPPDNATGNFTKVVQRIPVRIQFDDNSRCWRGWCRACRSSPASTPRPAMAENEQIPVAGRSRAAASRRSRLFAVAAVLLGSFLANFDSRLTTIGLPDLRGAFSLSFDEGAWLSTAGIGSQIFIAPAVAWLATVFGLRRVLGIPSLVYAAISLIIPFVHDYPTLLALSVVHGLLLGTFVPATLMIIFRNLPIRWWLPAISIYSIRVGFALDTSSSLVGFYVDHLGWQWLYWQSVVIAPLMGLMVYWGTPNEPVNRALLREADWGGMLLLGAGVSMIYAGLDQGNRLDWLGSGTVMALITAGAVLCAGLPRQRGPGATAVGAYQRAVLAQYGSGAGPDPALHADQSLQCVAGAEFLATIALLRPEQSGLLLLIYGALPMFVLRAALDLAAGRHSIRGRWWSWDLPASPPPISGARSSAMIGRARTSPASCCSRRSGSR